MMTKTYNKTYELMEKLAFNHYHIMYDRTSRKNVPGVSKWMLSMPYLPK